MSELTPRRSKRIRESMALRGELVEPEQTPTRQTKKKESSSSSFSLSEAPDFLLPYLSKNPSKRDGEWFFIWYSVAWVLIFACVVVSEVYKHVSDLGYFIIGASVCVPCFLLPLLFPSKADKRLKWYKRYAIKANFWIGPFNFVGNYFWTHYFFSLLGAKYTFPIKYTLNKIPPVCFLLTQPYFLTYHVTSNLVLRKIKNSTQNYRWLFMGIAVFVMSVTWSFIETYTIQMVPYYSFVDRQRMYLIGTFFYALYFIVSFPMFFRLDEEREKWTLSRTVIDSLASAMIVFILCDFWRLFIGSIIDVEQTKLPFGS